ncbi:hypothetical protein [Desulfofalx alkaliphila]|uniref:hypothetical protein n=1 Tax=Desulfofalx alkaliphila TaxID=105483 RepID=UPI0004E28D12|nr:hypothetical protein [Desulfofalx alkaliphila]
MCFMSTKAAKKLNCQKGQSLVSYLLGIGVIISLVAAILLDINGALANFHDAGVQYIENLANSGM